MKKMKTVTALILSLTMLPTLFACKPSSAVTPPASSVIEDSETSQTPPETSEDISSEVLPEVPPDSSVGPPSDSSVESPPAEPEPAPPVSTPTPPAEPDIPEEKPTLPQEAKYIRLSGNNVNLRKGAGTNHAVLTTSKQGTMYALTEKNGNWYKTYYRNQVAYIHASYVTVFTLEKSNNEAVEDVVAEGYKLLGTPYVYGAVRFHDGKGKLLAGFSVQKFDCSSLIQYIFYKGAGKLLNVNTRTQVKQGKYVKPSDLQRGDCIFFTNDERQYNTGIERVGHVALYLGNNYILHTASNYACIEQISAKRWSYYIEARRFL
ncbi:MAG: hypothetical protein E7371_04905 [Clostridiales bacterium]|nr:hypothetical protein [Clostridiales bacterium]